MERRRVHIANFPYFNELYLIPPLFILKQSLPRHQSNHKQHQEPKDVQSPPDPYRCPCQPSVIPTDEHSFPQEQENQKDIKMPPSELPAKNDPFTNHPSHQMEQKRSAEEVKDSDDNARNVAKGKRMREDNENRNPDIEG
ncbi:MAG: hypothetical protein Q9167_006934 [Letrouitia subvulpina]